MDRTATPAASIIEGRGIRKSYGAVEVLRGIDIDVYRGEVAAIVGPSGAGKSTLLQALGTLDRPDAGSVVYRCGGGRGARDGAGCGGGREAVGSEAVDVYRLSAGRLAAFRGANIGFVFQQHRLLPEFTMAENVALPALIAGEGRKEAMARAKALIDKLGLAERADHKPGQLSGGECQRAAVARALVNAPDVVLADEPSGSLDTANRRMLHRLFFDLRDELGCTFLIVTHDETLAADADRVISLRDGVVVT